MFFCAIEYRFLFPRVRPAEVIDVFRSCMADDGLRAEEAPLFVFFRGIVAVPVAVL